MENITIVGLKELNQKLSRIDRSLERIAKALEHFDKVYDRRIPREPMNLSTKADMMLNDWEDEDDDEGFGMTMM